MGINRIAAVWGFSEAVLFFIVPDVWLSIVGRKNLKKGLIACLYGLVGALLGGSILFWWGNYDFNSARTIIETVPAIDHSMLTRVQSELSTEGLIAMVFGPLSGTPYKTYAINAAHSEIHFGWFLLLSIPARLIRFVTVVILSHYFYCFIHNKTTFNPLSIILFAWFLFYSTYFYIMI